MRRHLFIAAATSIAIAAFVAAGPAPAKHSRSSSKRPTTVAQAPRPAPPATPKPSPTASPKAVVIGVAIFRPSPDAKLSNDPFKKLAEQLASFGPFQTWVVGDKDGCSDCSIEKAAIYIYAKRVPADDNTPNESLRFSSYFVSGSTIQPIKNDVSVEINKDNTVASLPDPDAKSLVGSLTFDENFQLAINLPDSEQTLQLVPAPVNATDPDFEPILEHILEDRGVAAQRSRFTASALHGPRDTITCPGAQRYLVYRVRLDQYPHKLRASTFLSAYTEGFVIDCTAPAYRPSAAAQYGKSFPQTSNLLNDFAAVLVALKPKVQTAAMTGGISSFSKLVDVDTGTKDVQTTVASVALEKMVDNLCIRLDEYAEPSPSPSPSGAPAPTPTPTPRAKSRFAQPSPVARVPLRCRSAYSRRQATVPPLPPAKAAASQRLADWFDAQMRSEPAPQPRATPPVTSTRTP